MKTNKFRLQHKLGAIQPTMNNSRNECRTKTHVWSTSWATYFQFVDCV